MDKKRLQEIKDDLSVWSEHHMKSGIIPELIVAVEQAQAELADMEVERIALEHGAAHVESELTKQLAECGAEVERLHKTTPVKIRDARISKVDLGTEQE